MRRSVLQSLRSLRVTADKSARSAVSFGFGWGFQQVFIIPIIQRVEPVGSKPKALGF